MLSLTKFLPLYISTASRSQLIFIQLCCFVSTAHNKHLCVQRSSPRRFWSWFAPDISSCSAYWIVITTCESCKFGLEDLVEWEGLFAMTSWIGCSVDCEAAMCDAAAAGVANLMLTFPFETFTTCTSHCGWPPTFALETSSPVWKTALQPYRGQSGCARPWRSARWLQITKTLPIILRSS